MGTVLTSAMLPTPQKSPFLLQGVGDLESKIRMRVEEMEFYHKLLSWLLLSCHEEKRSFIESLRKELADLRAIRFSALLDGVCRMKGEWTAAAVQTDLQADFAYLQLYFNHLDGALQLLKSRIHRRFGEFTHVCIW